MAGVGVSFIVFLLIRTQAGPAPGTMNKEYQEATNEYLKVSLCLFGNVGILSETNNDS